MIDAIRRKIYERRAAAVGMTVEEWLEHTEREHARTRAINDLIMNRDAQIAIIARNARAHGRSFYRWAVAL